MKSDEDKVLLRLFCHSCDNVNCKIWKDLGYITENSLQGCSKQIDLDTFSRYEHYTNEVIPFWKVIQSESLINEQYNEIINFFYNKIYPKDYKNIYDEKGKVIKEIKNESH